MNAPAIIDTNIVVAGLLTQRADAPVARILDGMLAARFPFALSESLLEEYRAVVMRPKLRARHGLEAGDIDIILTELATHAIVLAPVAGPPAPDPGDQFLWNLLAAHPSLILVTGDKRLLADPAMHPRLRTAKRFLEGR